MDPRFRRSFNPRRGLATWMFSTLSSFTTRERRRRSAPDYGYCAAEAVLRFLAGDAGEILESLPGHNRAIVSEPFANKHHVYTGQVLRIPLARADDMGRLPTR